MFWGLRCLAILAFGGWLLNPALGQAEPDRLNVAVSAPNNWDTSIVAVGQRAGIFRKHRIDPELLDDWLYGNPEGVKVYADYAKIPEKLAVRIRDEFMPKAAMSPDAVSGIDAITADAIAYRFMSSPLTKEQLAEVIQIPPAKGAQ